MQQQLTREISLSFNRKSGQFTLMWGSESIAQNVCEFLHTTSFLVGKDIEEYLLNTDTHYDTIRIPLTLSGKVITLELVEFVRFREIYGRQMFLLKLEDLLLRKGIQTPRTFLID
jgi:hypothetical protein